MRSLILSAILTDAIIAFVLQATAQQTGAWRLPHYQRQSPIQRVQDEIHTSAILQMAHAGRFDRGVR